MQRRIRTMEMRCYFKILRASYNDHVINEDVCAKIQQATGLHEDLPRRRLKWYGHVFRSSGWAKTILQGTVKREEDEAERKRGGKTISVNGQAWSSPSLKGQ